MHGQTSSGRRLPCHAHPSLAPPKHVQAALPYDRAPSLLRGVALFLARCVRHVRGAEATTAALTHNVTGLRPPAGFLHRDTNVLLRHCPATCGLRRFVVLREPWSQWLSDVAHFTPSPRALNDSTLLDIYPQDYLVCSTNSMMGVCSNGCDVNATLQLLRNFDFVGFTEQMGDVWRVLSDWVRCDAQSARAQGLARKLASSAAWERNRNVTSSAKSPSEYIRSTEVTLELQQARVAKLCANATSDWRSTTCEEGTDARTCTDCWNARKIITDLRHKLDVFAQLPSRAEFEQRNRCATQLYWAARQKFEGVAERSCSPTVRKLERYLVPKGWD